MFKAPDLGEPVLKMANFSGALADPNSVEKYSTGNLKSRCEIGFCAVLSLPAFLLFKIFPPSLLAYCSGGGFQQSLWKIKGEGNHTTYNQLVKRSAINYPIAKPSSISWEKNSG